MELLERLPPEIIVYILNLLSTKERIRLSCASDKLRDIFVSTPVLHRYVSFQNCWSLSSKTICSYISNFSSHIHYLNLQDCYWIKQTELVKCLKKCTQLIYLNVKCCNLSINGMNAIIDKSPQLKHLAYLVPGKLDYDKRKELFEKVIKQLTSFDFLLSEIPGRNVSALVEKLANACYVHVRPLPLSFILKIQEETFYDRRTCGGTCRNEVSLQFRRPVESQDATPRTRCNLRNCTGVNISTLACYKNFLRWHDRLCRDNYENCTENLKHVIFGSQMIDGDNYEDFESFLNRSSLEHISLNYILVDEAFIEETNLTIHYFLSLITSCNLETFDLQGCVVYMFDEIKEILERNCQTLKNINLLIGDPAEHHQDNDQITNVLTQCEQLKQVALRPCCLVTNQGSTATPPLKALTQSLKFLTELRIIGEDDRDEPEISSEKLESISEWKCLQKLTLAGIHVLGSSEFLITICQSCTELNYLSLANLKGRTLTHSSNANHFNTALTFCRNLKDFRIEQPYFDITKRFLEALHTAKKLERVVWKVQSGRLDKENIIPWMSKCSDIICVVICCDVTKKDAKTLQKLLIERYSSSRQALVVSIHSLHTFNMLDDPLKDLALQCTKNKFPLVHFEEVGRLYTQSEKPWKWN